MNPVEDQVIAIIAHAVMIPPGDVTPDARLSALGVTSLDQIECVMAVEEAFQVEIGQIDMWQLRTVQDVVDTVNKALAARETPAR
jgi:acyl carrier protein